MANARKCDRCGEFFDPLAQGEALMCRFKNPIFQDSNNLRENTVAKRLFSDEPPDIWVDLCPNCTTKFWIFMQNG